MGIRLSQIVLIAWFSLGIQVCLFGQDTLYGFYTVYDDSFREWVVPFEEIGEGEIRMKWPLKDDWTHWEINIGDYYGNVKRRWSSTPGQWEAKIDGALIDIKTIYPRDFRSWRLKMDGITLDLKMVYSNSAELWTLENKRAYMDIFTATEGDPRDWLVDDQLADIPIQMKLAAMVICIYHSCPKI